MIVVIIAPHPCQVYKTLTKRDVRTTFNVINLYISLSQDFLVDIDNYLTLFYSTYFIMYFSLFFHVLSQILKFRKYVLCTTLSVTISFKYNCTTFDYTVFVICNTLLFNIMLLIYIGCKIISKIKLFADLKPCKKVEAYSQLQ